MRSVAASLLLIVAGAAAAEPEVLGPDACAQCHASETEVWEGSQHAATFRELPRHPDVARYLEAVGTERNIRRDPTCMTCHFTVVAARGTHRPVAGPSCESCHGPASEWIAVHNDYGGAGVTAATESAEHRAQRRAAARDAGMIWSFMHYDAAANCMECHGLTNERIDTGVLAALHEAGHPVNAEFELVRYSQGTVRHRFYPPDVTHNAPLPAAGLARLYVLGQAAQYASAAAALDSAPDGAYHDAQERRRDAARAALADLKDIAEVATFLATPTTANGRALADALERIDLTERVVGRLPNPDSYQ